MGWGVWDVGTPDLSQRVLDRTGPDRTGPIPVLRHGCRDSPESAHIFRDTLALREEGLCRWLASK